MGAATAHLVSISGCRLRFSVCLLSVSLEEVWRGCKVGDEREENTHTYSFMYELVFVWEMLCGKREQVVISFRGISCPSSAHTDVINTVTNSSLWVLVCVTYFDIHVHVIPENVLLRWWCERVTPLLLWIIQASLFAEVITADKQTDRNAHRHVTFIYKACSSRKDCYIKIHLSRLC